MSDLPIWAQDEAREWLKEQYSTSRNPEADVSSLAALLVEVANNNPLRDDDHIAVSVKRGVLAEVRRVVEEVRAKSNTATEGCIAARQVCSEILSRLDAL